MNEGLADKDPHWSEKAAQRIIDDLDSRSGFEFGDIDEETAKEIRDSISLIIREEINSQSEELEEWRNAPRIGNSLVLQRLSSIRQMMKVARGEERSERSRRIAVSITHLETVIGYWLTFVENEQP